jgi:hypothetical protein
VNVSGDILALVVGMLLVAGVAGFSLLPLVIHTGSSSALPPQAEDSHTERQRIYKQVLEMEFDAQTGKLSSADFESLSRGLLARAASLLTAEGRSATDADDALEREIAAARRSRSGNRPIPLRATRRAS